MKKSSIIFMATAFFICMVNMHSVQAQKIVSGDLSFLKGEKSVNVVFVYSGLKIEKATEAEFVNNEAAEKDKKEAGAGDKFKADWEKDKTDRFIPAFNKILSEGLQIKTDNPGAKYTLIVYDMDMTNKGWGNKISGGKPASMNVNFKFVETANQTNTLCVISNENIRYMATTGTVAQKIQGCLEYAARILVKSMKKNM